MSNRKLTTDTVWAEVQRQKFAVLGTANDRGEPRTAGIVYLVHDRCLYIGTGRSSLKARNVECHPGVSLTVTIPKGIPFMPWLKIPPATITFRGEARLLRAEELDDALRKKLMGPLKLSPEAQADICYIEVKPVGYFVTYGVGVPLRDMLKPERAVARVPV